MTKTPWRFLFSTGVVYMLLATLGFAVMQSLVKTLSSFHVFEIIFFRSSITAVLCMGYLKSKKIPFRGSVQKLLFLRAIFGVFSITLFFITLQNMPIGASVSLKYLSPVFTAVLTLLFLDEKIKPMNWLYFAIALVGVFLLKGGDTRIDGLNLTLGIAGAFFGGLVYIVIRKIGQQEHPMVIINYFMLTAAVLSGLAMIPFWQTPHGTEWLILFSIGVSGYYSQVYMTKAFQVELANKVAPIKYMEVIYSLFIGLLWFDESYSAWGLLGILTILFGLTMILFNARTSSP